MVLLKKPLINIIFDIVSMSLWGLVSIILFIITINFIYNFTLKGYEYGKLFFSPPGDYLEESVVIPPNSSVSQVGEILEKKGIIKSALLFQLENLLTGSSRAYKGGEYVLNNFQDTNQINATLRGTGAKPDIKITIREGYSTKEIGEYLEGREIVTAEEFIVACKEEYNYSFLKDIKDRKNPLEGYLFPDTYFIADGASARDIIIKMLNRFEEVYDDKLKLLANARGLTTDQVITIASIIEKEISRNDERSLASAVIYNRLENDMPLQMCSSVLFVLDKRKDRLTTEDLQVKSPYNTYINKGLPPGPISNPGKACIEAALSPAASNFLYFVVKDEETGEHFFTQSYDEFLAAKEKYNQKY